MSDLENNMRMNLYRVLCPAPQVLGEYHLDLLSADQRNEVQANLIECHHCQRELAELATYMVSSQVPIWKSKTTLAPQNSG